MQTGFDIAQKYLDEAVELRRVLSLPENTQLKAVPLAQGEHNSNFWFAIPDTNKKYVLRINYVSQMGLKDQARYEFDALRILLPSNRTPAPIYLDDACTIIDKQLLVEEFCEGVQLDYEREGDLIRAACALADIHSVPVLSEDINVLVAPKDPLTEQLQECFECFKRYKLWSCANRKVISIVEEMMQIAERSIDLVGPPKGPKQIINTETVASHFLIGNHPSEDRIVDWEKPLLGECAQDIAYFLSPTTTIWDSDHVILDSTARDSFINAYWSAIDNRIARDDFDARFHAYAMTNCLRGITWSARAKVEYENAESKLRNEKTASRLDWYLDLNFLEYCFHEFF